MKRIVLLAGLALVAGCDRQSEDEAFQARAYGAAYGHFPKLGVELVVSRTSGRPAACGYARPVGGPPAPVVSHPFIWIDGRMYARERIFDLPEAETIRLCGPNWVGPSRLEGLSWRRAQGIPAGRDRSPAA